MSWRFLAFSLGVLLAPAASKFDLTVDNIMRGPALVGHPPRDVRWSGDSQRVFFEWKQYNEPLDKDPDTYVVNRDGTGLRKLSDDEAKQAPPLSGDQTADRKWTVYSSGGDLFLYDNLAGKRRQLTKTADSESQPHFTRDGKRVTFVRGSNLFELSLETGMLEQLTDIRTGGGGGSAAPEVTTSGGGGGRRGGGGARRGGGGGGSDDDEEKGTASQEYLKKEERELLQIVKQRAAKREEEKAKNKKENPRKPFRLASRQSVASLALSPDEKYIVAGIRESAEGDKSATIPNYITESAYTGELTARDKVGDVQSKMRMAILRVDTGESKWVEHGLKTKEDKPRDVQLTRPIWSEDGSKLVITARAADNKDRWIFALDPDTAQPRQLANIHDDAWVDGPGSFTLGWLPDNRRVFFQWEKDNYSHLFTVDFNGGDPVALTSGKWEVRDTQLSADKKQFLLTTSEVHPGEEHLYTMPLDGGPRTKITNMPGGHDATVSPDGTMLATVYSYTNKPPELYLQAMRPDAKPAKVTNSPAPDFFDYPWLDVPIVDIPARDGVMVPAHLYKPKNFRKGGPAVVFVHGAGYLQNIHRHWTNYYREYMFHHLLMERGFLVIDIDYRGSAGYGRDWRTAIYRHMGGKDLDDHIDAAKWLVKEHGVDPKKIGIYGGSYGGFITLMAMFTQPDVFKAGAALRPVTDWAHYNHPYTSNILNQPQMDAEAYKQSSPIYFAQNLKGALLICHGMVDVNVHFQDSVRLVQRLIELKKENWELAVYPVEDHGFVQPSSWSDEYKRILRLFEGNLK